MVKAPTVVDVDVADVAKPLNHQVLVDVRGDGDLVAYKSPWPRDQQVRVSGRGYAHSATMPDGTWVYSPLGEN